MKEKLKNEQIKQKHKIQICNDISSIKLAKNENFEKISNQSVILKDYYKSIDGNSIQEVRKEFLYIFGNINLNNLKS